MHRYLRIACFWSVGIAAIVYCYILGGIQLLMIGFFWGLWIVVGMRSGIEKAPREAWLRTPSRFRSVAGYTLLFVISFAPAAASLIWLNPVGSLSLAIVTVFSGAIVLRVLSRLFGDIKDVMQRAGQH